MQFYEYYVIEERFFGLHALHLHNVFKVEVCSHQAQFSRIQATNTVS